jgi:hypothetical protein
MPNSLKHNKYNQNSKCCTGSVTSFERFYQSIGTDTITITRCLDCVCCLIFKKVVIQISLADLNSVAASSRLHPKLYPLFRMPDDGQNPQTYLRYSKLVIFITETVDYKHLQIQLQISEHRRNKSESLNFNFRRVVNVLSFVWVTPRRLNFMRRRFGTLCSIFIGRVNKTHYLCRWNRVF